MAKIGLEMSIEIPKRLTNFTELGSVFSSTTFKRSVLTHNKVGRDSEILGTDDDVIVARGSNGPFER